MKENTLLKENIHKDTNINVYKHDIPSHREWTNSLYSYNKNYVKNLPQKDNYLYKLIKAYLHLVPTVRNSTKSKRLRDSLSRNSTKQIFISKPEIKQNSDKINIMLYLYNRENKLSNRRIYYFNKFMVRYVNKHLNNNIPVKLNRRFKRTINSDKKLSYKFSIYNNMNTSLIYRYIITVIAQKRNDMRKSFLTWCFASLGLKLELKRKYGTRCMWYLNLVRTNDKNNEPVQSHLLNSGRRNVITKKMKKKILILTRQMLFTYYNMNNLVKAQQYYYKEYTGIFINKHLKAELLYIKTIFKLHISKKKLGKMIIGLKSLIGNIYSKKVELNVINLKYIHMNSDILTEAIGIKLRNRRGNILSIFKKALSFLKIPKINSSVNLLNNMNYIDKFKSSDLNNIIDNKKVNYIIPDKDTISLVLNNIFPYKSLNFLSKFKNVSIFNLLNGIHYKWVTGIRLEGKGRLTRRFTASRSVFKYKYRGSLKNLEHLTVPYYRKNTLNNVMIRNQEKSNIQYTFTSNKKRVGVYGIKGWISNN